MDRVDLSDAIIQELATVFADELRGMTREMWQGDLETLERGMQQMSRRVYGQTVSALLQVRAEEMERPGACEACGGRLRLSGAKRVRQARGLVGDITLCRAAYVCLACHRGWAPLDTVLGMGPWGVTPGLARVGSFAGSTGSFAEASESIRESVGVEMPVETVRTLSEAVGAVAEAEQQEAIAAVGAGTLHETTEGAQTLLVEVDGVQVPHVDGWHEIKIGRVAPLGPQSQTDPQMGRTTLRLGASLCGGGLEGTDAFWLRVQMLALQGGRGDATRQVVVLCDGALWIWARAASVLAGPRREVIEIVDIFHAYEHLWTVGRALYPVADACAAWVKPLADALYDQGAPAVLAALEAAHPPSAEAADVLRVTHDYFAGNATRMDYPRFVAQQLPIGSGAIESLCKNLVEERAKGAGMRWRAPGVQHIISLRALHRSIRPLDRLLVPSSLDDLSASLAPYATPRRAPLSRPLTPRPAARSSTAHHCAAASRSAPSSALSLASWSRRHSPLCLILPH